MEFDFKTAWNEAAYPAFVLDMPLEGMALYRMVIRDAASLTQNRPSLDMPWPSGLRERFELLGDTDIAQTAAIIHAYGHWHSGKNPDNVGGHWKLANYCDQVLSHRLDLVRRPTYHAVHPSMNFEVHQGVLRVCLSHRDFWQWHEVCLAIRFNLDIIKHDTDLPKMPPDASRQEAEKWADTWKETCENLRAKMMPKTGNLARILNTSEFMTEPKCHYCGSAKGKNP